MQNDEIKSAVDNIKKFYGDSLHSKDAGIVTKAVEALLDLANAYIQASAKFPEERKFKIGEEFITDNFRSSGFNESRSLCIMAAMKMLPTEGELDNAITEACGGKIEGLGNSLHSFLLTKMGVR